jgi:cell division protein FtsQ
MQKNLSQEPWIKTLVIYRQFPSSINIVIEEEKPYALYEENGIMSFVTQQGKILEEINESVNLPDYLIVSGKNANLGYNALLDIVYKYPEIYDQLLGLEKVGERRWNLKLENNTIIKLPEHNIELALDIFHDLFEKTPYQLSYIVDLRLIPDKIYMKVL